jgi:AcrR family transcriptional regulator
VLGDTIVGLRRRKLHDTRQRILAAVEDLSCEAGPARLSLEAVAARAGVSKGGLLYHFPCKHDLLRALVAAHVEELRNAIDRHAPGALAAGDAAAARGYLMTLREMLGGPDRPPAGVFAALAEDPEFIAPLREFRAELRALFRLAADPATAEVVFLACEGLVHEELTDPGAFDAAAREAVFSVLAGMLEAGSRCGGRKR